MRLGPPPRMMTLRRSVGSASHSAGRSAVALVAGIEVGRARRELGGAGVDALVDRAHAEARAAAATSAADLPGELGQARVGEAHLLEASRPLASVGRPLGAHLGLDRRRAPRSGAGTTGRTCRRARSPRPRGRGGRPGRSPAGGRASAAPGRRRWRDLSGAPSISISSRPVRPVSIERSAFCSDSWKVRPIAIASPTVFIEVVSSGSAPGNFSKVKRGILVTT